MSIIILKGCRRKLFVFMKSYASLQQFFSTVCLSVFLTWILDIYKVPLLFIILFVLFSCSHFLTLFLFLSHSHSCCLVLLLLILTYLFLFLLLSSSHFFPLFLLFSCSFALTFLLYFSCSLVIFLSVVFPLIRSKLIFLVLSLFYPTLSHVTRSFYIVIFLL